MSGTIGNAYSLRDGGAVVDMPDDPVRVALVDDEPAVVAEMEAYLIRKGFDVVSFTESDQALEEVRRDPSISVMFTDLRMPVMDGLELIRRLRGSLAAEREMEIVVFTGYAGRDEAIEALQLGAADFLVKPVSLKQVAHCARRCVDAVRARQFERHYRHALEATLREQQRLIDAHRDFVALVSHEFRTPLAIIDGAAQRLIRRKDDIDPDEIMNRAGNIRKTVGRLAELIETTLQAARVDAGKIECNPVAFDLAALIREACDAQAEIDTPHDFELDLAGLPPLVTGDPALLELVFRNLLSNAVKYSPNADSVSIKGTTGGGDVLVSVTDHGVGIPGDEVGRLFERFFRARTSQGISGTGIGLNLVREIIHMHGGEISVRSREGEGTTFSVVLPGAAADEADLRRVGEGR